MPKSSSRSRTQTYRPGMRGRTDWERVRKTTDEEIDRQIAEDPDTAPEFDASWMAHAELVLPEGKEAISIRLDGEVLEYFRSTGRGYQTRINAVLRSYVRAQKARLSEVREIPVQPTSPKSRARGRRKA